MRKSLMTLITILLTLVLASAVTAADEAAPEEIVQKVKAAAEFLSKAGEPGLADFNQKDGPWVWSDTYITVHECEKGIAVAHPMKPKLIGKKLTGIKDIKGNLFFIQLCDAAKKPNGAWTEYWWPKPGEKKPSRKVTYFVQVPNTPYQLGAGIYDENLKIEDLQKLITQ